MVRVTNINLSYVLAVKRRRINGWKTYALAQCEQKNVEMKKFSTQALNLIVSYIIFKNV